MVAWRVDILSQFEDVGETKANIVDVLRSRALHTRPISFGSVLLASEVRACIWFTVVSADRQQGDQ